MKFTPGDRVACLEEGGFPGPSLPPVFQVEIDY